MILTPIFESFRLAADDQLSIDEVIRVLRLLTFSGSHPHITDQQLMTPDQIVDVVLHGTLNPPTSRDS